MSCSTLAEMERKQVRRHALRRIVAATGPPWELVLAAGLVLAMMLALSVGKYPVAIGEIPRFFLASLGLCDMAADRYAALANVIIDIRLPRVLSAVLVGSALASSGAAFQAVFRNPLVSPGLLGVLSGASFGAALGIVLGVSWYVVQSLAFVMGLGAVVFGVAVARLFGNAATLTLVLGGMVSGALFASLLSITKYIADPMNALPNIVYWLMGNLAQSNLHQIAWLTIPMFGGVLLLGVLGRALDALAMGDDEARSLGVPVGVIRFAVIATATLISSLTVSIAGMIGWIGLIVPHIVRLALGASNTRLMPSSALFGAMFLLGADYLARTLADTEIPIGIVTELLGIPIFLLVLSRTSRGWNER
ncbi:MAG TPA: iron ABC transporter permease [Rhizomicrobium sp.]